MEPIARLGQYPTYTQANRMLSCAQAPFDLVPQPSLSVPVIDLSGVSWDPRQPSRPRRCNPFECERQSTVLGIPLQPGSQAFLSRPFDTAAADRQTRLPSHDGVTAFSGGYPIGPREYAVHGYGLQSANPGYPLNSSDTGSLQPAFPDHHALSSYARIQRAPRELGPVMGLYVRQAPGVGMEARPLAFSPSPIGPQLMQRWAVCVSPHFQSRHPQPLPCGLFPPSEDPGFYSARRQFAVPTWERRYAIEEALVPISWRRGAGAARPETRLFQVAYSADLDGTERRGSGWIAEGLGDRQRSLKAKKTLRRGFLIEPGAPRVSDHRSADAGGNSILPFSASRLEFQGHEETTEAERRSGAEVHRRRDTVLKVTKKLIGIGAFIVQALV